MDHQGAGVTLPEWILLLPVGRVELVDRPEPLEVDPESLAVMVGAFRSRGVDLVIDYEHQSLQGRQAPAAGWIRDLEDRGDGLWARVEWTPQAREYLRNREYRYFSPVLQLDPETRKPLALMQVGLTNVPAIKRLPPLVAKWQGAAPEKEEVVAQVPSQTPENEGNKSAQARQQLKSFLGLSPEATDEAAWAGALELGQNLAAALKLPEEATGAQILEAAEAMQLKVQQLAQMEEELRHLRFRLAAETTDQAVEEALKAGKIAPAQKPWAREYFRQDPEGFQTFVARAPQLVPTGLELHLRRDDLPTPGPLTPEEAVLCRCLKLSPEQYLQAKARTHRDH